MSAALHSKPGASRRDLLKVVRDSHWNEIADYLGQPVNRVRETFRLYLELLDQLGYAVVRKGDEPARPVRPTELVPLNRERLFDAVEGVLQEMTERRLHGERISDQAEVRAIVKAVQDEVDGARAGA